MVSHANPVHIPQQYPASFGSYQSPLDTSRFAISPTPEYLQPFNGLFSPALLPGLGMDDMSLGFPRPLYFTTQDINAMLSTPTTVTPPPDFAVPNISAGNSFHFNGGVPCILPTVISSPLDKFLSPRTSHDASEFFNSLSGFEADSTLCKSPVFNFDITAVVPHVSAYESQPTKRRRRLADNVVRNNPVMQGHEGPLKSDKQSGIPSKNRHRNTRSIPQKTKFYKWIIDHIDHPFPTDKDRESLCVDVFDKKDFYWWFSNHRHRNLKCTTDERGKKVYTPKLTFYKTCQRLGLEMPWPVPEDIKCQLKRTHS
ncbi:hypothetical protein GGI08_009343 [Coemansia sp. S2]|nr:hypothetical protein GGI08_009343 [Coemansia sp. S2]